MDRIYKIKAGKNHVNPVNPVYSGFVWQASLVFLRHAPGSFSRQLETPGGIHMLFCQRVSTAPRAALLAVMSLALWSAFALGQTSQTSPVQTCQLGNLTLESGEVIRDFRMTYITFGTLGDSDGEG
jgi:hypothetical protein